LNQKLLELNSILDTTSEGLVLLDRSLKILEVNRSVCRMLETTPSNLIGKSAKEEDTSPHKALMISTKVRQALIDKTISTHQEEIILSGQKETPVERSITPVENIAGEINGWLLVFRDLTEEHKLANFRQDLTRMLVHDLRSPIVTVQGGLDMIEILLDDGELETIPEMIEISRNSSVKMLDMINELLNINQLETGELKLQLEKIILPNMCQELSNQFSSILQKADLHLVTEFAADLPVISADANLLKRVIHNLLDNAVKFTSNGGKIKLGIKRSPANPNRVWVVVCDNGPGISPEKQKQIFHKNITYHTAGARRRGSGLGLYFCKLAVTAHQGNIWVKSEEGKGSCFTVELPTSQKVP
jgi:PAS domain S-box-containing protein